MIFPFPTPVYVVGAAGYWLKHGAYAENERIRLVLLRLDPIRRMRANLKAMESINQGIRLRKVSPPLDHSEAQVYA